MPVQLSIYVGLMLIGLVLAGIFLGVLCGIYYEKRRWRFCAESLPKRDGPVMNYPVAFFDDEFGIVVDQAEYHPNRVDTWVMVPNGEPCRPYAWFDLPSPPHPYMAPVAVSDRSF